MQHYYHPMSRAVTTDWLLRELGADHEQIVIDYQTGENHSEAYLAINPMGKIPALVDGDVVVTETAAICAYLADKFIDRGLAPPVDSPLRGTYYRYLFYPGITLEPMFTVEQIEGAELSPQSTGWGDLASCLRAMEQMTPAQNWVLGADFSAADLVFGGTLDFAIHFGWLTDPSTKIADYVQRIKQRPAYRESHDASWH